MYKEKFCLKKVRNFFDIFFVIKFYIYTFFSSVLQKIEHTIQTILRHFFFRNAVEREPVPTRVLNPKEFGVKGRSPGRGPWGKATRIKKMFDKIS